MPHITNPAHGLPPADLPHQTRDYFLNPEEKPQVDLVRLNAAVEKGTDALWAAVCEAFPEVTTGDFPFDADLELGQSIRGAVRLWLRYNLPEEEGPTPRRCFDCGRPMYFDQQDEDYHHAVDAARGCFLTGPEDRPDDTAHPLVNTEVTR